MQKLSSPASNAGIRTNSHIPVQDRAAHQLRHFTSTCDQIARVHQTFQENYQQKHVIPKQILKKTPAAAVTGREKIQKADHAF